MLAQPHAQGFTAVELLVTLFVAALFIASGYQLYAVTTNDSTEVRERAMASNIAYSYLKKAQAKGFFVCGNETPPTAETAASKLEFPGMIDVTIKRSMLNSAPCGNGLMRIQVDLRYNSVNGETLTQSQVVYVNAQ